METNLICKKCILQICGGKEPHRWDWTQEMLPEGYRPLLLNETISWWKDGDEYSSDSSQKPDFHWQAKCLSSSLTPVRGFWRTKRPLPQPEPDAYEPFREALKAGKTVQSLTISNGWLDWLGGDDFSPINPQNLRIKPEPEEWAKEKEVEQ
jgi:hypothetical protein